MAEQCTPTPASVAEQCTPTPASVAEPSTPISAVVASSAAEYLQYSLSAQPQNNAQAGAVATFTGTVRQNVQVKQLQVVASVSLTLPTMKAIGCIVAAKWPLMHIAVVQRAGYIAVGEPIVHIAVSSAHRSAALSACQCLTDLLKTLVPLWKKEHYLDGTAQWLEPTPNDERIKAEWLAEIPQLKLLQFPSIDNLTSVASG